MRPGAARRRARWSRRAHPTARSRAAERSDSPSRARRGSCSGWSTPAGSPRGPGGRAVTLTVTGRRVDAILEARRAALLELLEPLSGGERRDTPGRAPRAPARRPHRGRGRREATLPALRAPRVRALPRRAGCLVRSRDADAGGARGRRARRRAGAARRHDRERIAAGRAVVEDALTAGTAVYGVTTGFGQLESVRDRGRRRRAAAGQPGALARRRLRDRRCRTRSCAGCCCCSPRRCGAATRACGSSSSSSCSRCSSAA